MSPIEKDLWIAAYAATIVQIVVGGEYNSNRLPETHDAWAKAVANRAVLAFRAGAGIPFAL